MGCTSYRNRKNGRIDTMKHLTLHTLAGYATESALWQLKDDLCRIITNNPTITAHDLIPDRIVVEGKQFVWLAEEQSMAHNDKFTAPELLVGSKTAKSDQSHPLSSAALVWTVGALLCYCSSGRYVFGGKGGKYQLNHPDVLLPPLRKEHESLVDVVHACMLANPDKRITIAQLKDIRPSNTLCQKETRLSQSVSINKIVTSKELSKQNNSSVWPEEFIPST